MESQARESHGRELHRILEETVRSRRVLVQVTSSVQADGVGAQGHEPWAVHPYWRRCPEAGQSVRQPLDRIQALRYHAESVCRSQHVALLLHQR